MEERLQRQRGRRTSLVARGPRCPLSEAKSRVFRRPPQSRSYWRDQGFLVLLEAGPYAMPPKLRAPWSQLPHPGSGAAA